MYQGVLAVYYQLFYFTEEEEILDPLNDLHVAVLHHVFLPKIQEKLDIWNRAWSQHRIRTARSSPIRMWIVGQLQNNVGIELESEAINSYGLEGFTDDNDAGDNSKCRPLFPSLKFHHCGGIDVPRYCPVL